MTRPLCRYCGKPIPKRTIAVSFVRELRGRSSDKFHRYIIGHPATKAEAQRLVNETIVSVKHDSDPWAHDITDRYVCEAGIWDGESYVDPYFCNGAHAKDFAYMIARSRPTLGSETWAKAVETPHV